MKERTYFVYLLASKSRRLYTGVTNDLERRLFEHKSKLADGFTKRYNIDRLVYFEQTSDVLSAIGREKQIKSWNRDKKIALIESINPTWEDLSAEWYKQEQEQPPSCHSEPPYGDKLREESAVKNRKKQIPRRSASE